MFLNCDVTQYKPLQTLHGRLDVLFCANLPSLPSSLSITATDSARKLLSQPVMLLLSDVISRQNRVDNSSVMNSHEARVRTSRVHIADVTSTS